MALADGSTNPLDTIKRTVGEAITRAFELLLEHHHLYQSITVTINNDTILELARKTRRTEDITRIAVGGSLNLLWNSDRTSRRIPHPGPQPNDIRFKLPGIRTTCHVCEKVFPFNLLREIDAHEGFDLGTQGNTLQIFCLIFQCQNCRGIPEAFMIRREGSKLTLCGRSPIEKVVVPSVIPKQEKKFYSDAMVAHNSGQTLAGLFLLRTFIEQHCRRITEDLKSPPETVLDSYNASLEPAFRDRFPSFKHLYALLSDALHSANADTKLFDKVKQDLETHFDGKRLFELTNPGKKKN